MKRGIIFDMDGTLWDSAENVAKSWNVAIRQYGVREKELTTQDIQGVMGKTMDVIANILFAENDYLREHGGILYDQVPQTLAALKRDGYHLSIVSNCQKGYIEAFLDHYDLWKLVEDIECYGNNLRQKGENIRLVVERNRLDEAVYVGDIQGDYDASRAAGVGFIHAAYGFGEIAEPVPELKTFADLKTFDISSASKTQSAWTM